MINNLKLIIKLKYYSLDIKDREIINQILNDSHR